MSSSKGPNLSVERPNTISGTETKQFAKLQSKEVHSSAYRLSRVPQKFDVAKLRQANKSESWAESFFKSNPDQKVDKRPPIEKLEEISSKIAENGQEYQERLSLLLQQKALRYIIYGENSVQSLQSHAEIGILYNKNERYSSAVRHLQKAYQMESLEVVKNDSQMPVLLIEVTVELAEAYLNLAKTSNTRQNLDSAEQCVIRINFDQVDDLIMKSRIALIKARAKSIGKKNAEAIDLYKSALDITADAYQNAPHIKIAQLYEEMAQNAENAKNDKNGLLNKMILSTDISSLVGNYYSEAYNMYVDLELLDDAERVRSKVPTDYTEQDVSNETKSLFEAEVQKPQVDEPIEIKHKEEKIENKPSQELKQQQPIIEKKPLPQENEIKQPQENNVTPVKPKPVENTPKKAEIESKPEIPSPKEEPLSENSVDDGFEDEFDDEKADDNDEDIEKTEENDEKGEDKGDTGFDNDFDF